MDDHTEEELLFSDDKEKFKDNEIHIRKQNRKRKKWLTTIENIPESYDMEKLVAVLKRELCCNGTIVIEPRTEKKVIQMQGDHGTKIQVKLQEIFPLYTILLFGN